MSDEKILQKLSDSQRRKVEELLAQGYRLNGQDYWEVELVKGYSYYRVDRSGRKYAI